MNISQILNKDLEYNGFKISAKIKEDKIIVRFFPKHEYSSFSYILPLSEWNKKYLTFVDSKGSVKNFYIKNDLGVEKTLDKEKRYIIEFKETPIFVKKTEIEGEVKPQKHFSDADIGSNFLKKQNNMIDELNLHIRVITETHEMAKKEIKRISSKKGFNKQPVIKEFKNLFNGMVVVADEDSLEEIKNLKYVKSVYEDSIVKVFLENSVHLINANELWNFKDDNNRNITGEGIKIAIIDTGVDYTHPDLGNCTKTQFINGSCEKVIGGYDFVNSDNDPMDDNGHGTHVAGIAAGNGTLKGVAPNARLLAYKVLDAWGYGYSSDIINAIEMAVENETDIILLSLGMESSPNHPLAQAVNNAVDSGVLVVVAAGNSGPHYETINCPGNARKALTVGASNSSNGVASFSSRGPVIWEDEVFLKPEVVAPGVKICSAQWDSAYNEYLCKDDKHINLTGTSMAAPHVAGAAALLKQAHPDFSVEDIKSSLMLTATDLGDEIIVQGTGRINVTKAYNTSILTYPQTIDISFQGDGNTVGSKEVRIKNLRPYQITVNIIPENARNKNKEEFQIITVNASSIDIPSSSEVALNVTMNLTGVSDIVFGKIILVVEGNNYTLPYIGANLVNLSIIVNSTEPLYPDIYLHDDSLNTKRVAYQLYDFYGNNYTFKIPAGNNYTIYAIGDFLNESSEYILVGYVSSLQKNMNLVLNLSDARKFSVRGESLSYKPLRLYNWEKKFISYKDDKVMYGSLISFYVEGNRTVFISQKPENGLDTDIILKYSGIPVG